MLTGTYKGKTYYYNQFLMEIYEDIGNGKLRKKRDFHKWENLINWTPEDNILACESIKEYNKKHYG